MKKNFKPLLIVLGLFLTLNLNAQLRVAWDGSVSIGNPNNIWARLHVTGTGLFSSATNTSNIISSPYIRGNYLYSTASTPDFTWWNNDKTGIFHPANNYLGFSIGGVERMLLQNSGLKVTGNISTTGTYLTISDVNFKTNIKNITNALDKVLSLRGVTYNLIIEDSLSSFNAKQEYLGLIAQEVEEIVPEVVKSLEDGMKAIAYPELIGLLIEAIKQQNEEIKDMKKYMNAVKDKIPVDIDGGCFENFSCKLYQNSPNPFNSNTVINYKTSQTANNMILIFDIQGALIKSYKNLKSGDGEIIINASELNPGIYLYSLISDNKEIDTKRMILMKE